MKKFFVLMAVAVLALTACEQPDPAPEAQMIQVNEDGTPWDGGEVEFYVVANCNWELRVENDVDLKFTPSRGTGDGTVKLTVPANKTNEEMQLPFKFYISSNDGQYLEMLFTVVIPKPSLEYGDRTYEVVYLEDGNYWMAEPLAYVPQGVTVSENPADGIVMYPYTVKDGAVAVAKDEATIKANGYLYKADAFMGTAITADNCLKLEGAQGICPNGWHIPTWAEWFNLVGASNKLANGDAVANNEKAIFWDAALGYGSVVKANEKGFNFVFSGTIANSTYQKGVTSETTTDVADFLGKPSMTYFACSSGILTAKGEPQMFAPMTTFTKSYLKGRLSIAYANTAKVASQVRCVKDAK